MIDNPSHNPAIHKLTESMIFAKGRELAETVPDNRPPEVLASVSYAVGFQAALELAMLDPDLAHQMILDIHASQLRDDPDAGEEFNHTALTLIGLWSKLNADGQGQEPRRLA